MLQFVLDVDWCSFNYGQCQSLDNITYFMALVCSLTRHCCIRGSERKIKPSLGQLYEGFKWQDQKAERRDQSGKRVTELKDRNEGKRKSRKRFCHVGWKLRLLGSGHSVEPRMLPPTQQGCVKARSWPDDTHIHNNPFKIHAHQITNTTAHVTSLYDLETRVKTFIWRVCNTSFQWMCRESGEERTGDDWQGWCSLFPSVLQQ